MLTEKHLAVVRAALRYMDEEMSPSGSAAMYHYFDQRGKVCQPTIGDVADARKFFNAVELSYALVDASGLVIESERLVPASLDGEVSLQSDLSMIASVLVPVS